MASQSFFDSLSNNTRKPTKEGKGTMKRDTRKFGLALTALTLVALLLAVFGAVPTRAATPIYVRPNGDDVDCNGTTNTPYPGTGGPGLDCAVKTIQKGIELVDTGGTVNVADGTYTITAAITVDKGVTITGNTGSPENVEVQYVPASTSLNGFEIGAADITIQGFKIVGCFRGVHFGRSDTTSTGCTITNCVFDDIHENAIGEVAAENTTISNNTITNCTQQGIEIRANEATSLENRTEVTGNTISSCAQACIQTYLGKYVYIYNNTINATEDKGINVIRPNATGTADRIQVIGNTISETKWPGIQVIGAPYTYVYDNTLTKCNYYGDGTGDWDYASIHVQDDGATAGSNVTVDSNTISDGINGIQIWSDNCTVTDNTIYNMGLTYADTKVTGDGTYYNSGIIIGTNWLTNNNKPTGTTITGNSIYDNYWGLYVRDYATLSSADPAALNVTAEENWWGAADGPGGAGPGSGDDVSVTVDYSPWLGATPSTSPMTWYTNDSVQDAIDAANGGDTINVADGTYTITGAITVDKGVTITGNTGSPSSVLVTYAAAQDIHNGFEIGAANITIQGIKVVNCKHGFFFDRNNTTYTGCTITHCAVETASNCGIGEIATPSTTISYNTITDCGDKGIYVRKCESASEATRTEIVGNTLSNCGKSWGAAAIQTFEGKFVYIYNNTIGPTNDKGINVIRANATGTSDRIQVINNTISLCKFPGIQSFGAPYTYIYNNTLTKCNYDAGDGTPDFDYGSITVADDGDTDGNHVIVDNNDVSDGGNGILIWSDNCTVTNNDIYDMGLSYLDSKPQSGNDGPWYNSAIVIGGLYETDPNDPIGTTITSNTIHANYWGLQHDSRRANYVTAEDNWWGDASGPGPVGPGSGDNVSDNVDYSPWWGDATGTFTVEENPDGELEVGTDADADAVQSLIDAVSTGTTIVLPDVTYTPSGGFTINTSGITIKLSDGTIIQSSSPCFTVNADNTTITSATPGFPGGCTPSGGSPGIQVNTPRNNLVIRGIEIKSAASGASGDGDGIHVGDGDAGDDVTNLQILDNYIHDNNGDGVEFDNVDLLGVFEMKGNAFRNNGVGVKNTSSTDHGSGDIDAEYNEWGAVGGPAISAGVDGDPWVYASARVDPATQKVREAYDATVTIKGDFKSLSGAEFWLSYETAKLTFKDLSLSGGAFDTTNSTCQNVTSTAGVIKFRCSRSESDGGYDGAEGTLASIIFTANDLVGPTTADLTFSNVKFAAYDAPPGVGSVNIYFDETTQVTDGEIQILATTDLTGRVDLQGRPGDSDATFTFDVGPVEGYDPGSKTTDYWGAFSFNDVTEDTYDITVSMNRYLDVTTASSKSKSISGNTLTLNTLVLLGGDADDTTDGTTPNPAAGTAGVIDISDAVIIGNQFGNSPLTDVRADINNDGTVDILDLVLMGGNYGKESATTYAGWSP